MSPVLLPAAAADAPTLLLPVTPDEDTGVPACVNCPVDPGFEVGGYDFKGDPAASLAYLLRRENRCWRRTGRRKVLAKAGPDPFSLMLGERTQSDRKQLSSPQKAVLSPECPLAFCPMASLIVP